MPDASRLGAGEVELDVDGLVVALFAALRMQTAEELKAVEARLNQRLRKIKGWRTRLGSSPR